MSEETVTLCLVGAGRWYRRMHRPVMQRLAEAGRTRVLGVCDLEAERAERARGELSAESTWSDAAEMLARCRPDGVVLLLPPEATAGAIESAIDAGVPFLTEKPPAPDVATHRRLTERVGELPHLVGYNRRFVPYVTRAREWLAGERVQCVTTLFARHRRHDDDFSTTAVHPIDTTRFLAGDEFGELHLAVAPGGRVKNLFVNGWTRGGGRVDIAITPDTASACEHYVVRGERRSAVIVCPQSKVHDLPGYVELHEGNRVAERVGPGEVGIEPADLPALAGFAAEHEAFCDALADGAAIEATLADTLSTQRVREALGGLVAGDGIREATLDLSR